MGLAKRFYGHASAAPESLRYTQPGGAPLVVEPGEVVTPSRADGWVEIGGKGRSRFARGVLARAEKPQQLSLFD